MKKIFLSALAVFTLFSCEDYLDVNEDQNNNANYSAISPKQMLGGVIVGYARNQNVGLNDFGNRMAYIWGLNTGFTSTDPAYDYNFNSSSYNGLFNTTFTAAGNCQNIIDKQAKFPNYEYHIGIAKILKVMSFDYITALYGDVPYTQAFKGLANPYPAYDDDKVIIPALWQELQDARALLNTTNPNVTALSAEDIVFGGDVTKWNLFLNTVQLKLALRLSKTTDANLVALRTAMFNDLNSNSRAFVNEDVRYNPGFSIAVSKRNPVFETWGLNDGLDAFTSANRAQAAGDFVARLVNGTMNDANITTGIVDPRRSRMFALVGGQVVGNVQGNFPASTISRFGSFFFGRIGADATDANNNASIRDGYIMLNAESHFLQAEAIQRGYLTSGSAQTEFNAGIDASFDFNNRLWGTVTAGQVPPISAATLTAYKTAIDTRNGLGWTASTDKISAIMTQKYIALSNWHGIEPYLDHHRTGYPVLPLPVSVTTRTTRPFRMIYPSREYSTNSANVPVITLNDLFTNGPTTPYYLQN